MQAKAGTFNKTTASATASQSVSGLGFQPNIVLFWTVGPNGNNAWAAGARPCLGFSVDEGGTLKHRAIAAGIRDAQATAATSRMFSNTKSILVSDGGTAAGSLLCEAHVSSFDSGGFTLSWTKNNLQAYQIHYLAMQVPGVAVRNFDISGNGSGSITGLGFQPSAIFSIINPTTTYQTTTPVATANFRLGAAAASGAWGTHWASGNGVADATTASASQSGYFLVDAVSASPGTAIAARIALASLNADGITYTVTGFTAARSVEVLLLGGVEAYAETFDKTTAAATAAQARTGYGFQPKAAIVHTSSKTTNTSTNSAHVRQSLGFSDGTDEYSGTFYDTNALATSNANSYMANAKAIGTVTTDTDAIASEADLAFDTDGMTFSWTTNDANAHEVMVLAFGDAGPADVNTADGDTIVGSDTATIAATLPVTDLDTVAAAESVSVSATRTNADNGALAAAESLAVAAVLPLSDLDTVAATESLAVVTGTTPAVSDAGTVAGAEALAVSVVLPVADAGTVAGVDALAVVTNATVTLADGGTVVGTDAAALAGSVGVSDAGTASGADAATVAATLALADADAVVGTEAFSVEGDGTEQVSDAGEIGAAESVTVASVAAVADTGAVSAVDTLDVSGEGAAATADAGTIGASESLAVVTTVALSDLGAVLSAEAVQAAAEAVVADGGTVGSLDELAATALVAVSLADGGALAIVEAVGIIAGTGPTYPPPVLVFDAGPLPGTSFAATAPVGTSFAAGPLPATFEAGDV